MKRRGLRYTQLAVATALLTLAVYWNLPAASEFRCPYGEVAEADIGDGVVMRTCFWQQKPDLVIRVGPLELIKNGILILQTQTDVNGKLHGRFSSWDDDGVLIENGHYVQGQKQGIWMIADQSGQQRFFHYRGGIPTGL